MGPRNETLRDWQALVGGWAVLTFGPGRRVGPHVEHLRRELAELAEAAAAERWDRFAEEMADVLSLLLALAHRNGVDLAAALAAKFEVNRRRQWGPPDADGVIEHRRDV
jgi:hypothetical protein